MSELRINDALPKTDTCSICPHTNGCRDATACLYDIAASDIETFQSPRLMLPAQARNVMSALKDGNTVKRITGGGRHGQPIVTVTKLDKHCAAYPAWGAEVKRLATENRLKADHLKGSPRRDRTHCSHGHLLPTTIKIWNGRAYRHCETCRRAQDLRGCMPKPDVIKKVRAALLEKRSITSFTAGGKPGFLLSHRNLTHLRREVLEFDRLITETIKGSNFRAQQQRFAHQKFINGGPAVQNRYYSEIMSMVPRYIPDRDDVVSNIFCALLDGSLRHDQIKDRISKFVTDHNRLFPTKFAKFGDSPLVSLDQVLFEDGSMTRGDTVSRGLWD